MGKERDQELADAYNQRSQEEAAGKAHADVAEKLPTEATREEIVEALEDHRIN